MVWRRVDRDEDFSFFKPLVKSGATIGLPTGLGGSYARGRNIETRELDHTEACPRTAAATDLTDA